jgi:hypothetical protein
MFCPRCGQERISEETSFCSRCGFLLTGLTALLKNEGVPATVRPVDEKSVSPRTKGIRQGILMFLLTFMIAPIVGLISQFGLGIEPWPVGIVVFGFGIGGLVRIAYALMFESKSRERSSRTSLQDNQHFESAELFSVPVKGQVAPASAHDIVESPRSNRRLETTDLHPHSVTDSTTKLLETDIDDKS